MSKSIYTPEQEKLQTLLQQIRLEAGLRQVDQAKLIGQTQACISKYESGERRLDLLELKKICEPMGTTLEEFVRRFEKLVNETR